MAAGPRFCRPGIGAGRTQGKIAFHAGELDDAAEAERLIRNLAQRLEHEARGVSGSLLEGLEEILTVTRLGLPAELRRSLACTNIIENMMGTIRRVTRNVKHRRLASMALRRTAAAMLEAKKGFRGLKAYKQLPALRGTLIARSGRIKTRNLDKQLKVSNANGNNRSTNFNKARDIRWYAVF